MQRRSHRFVLVPYSFPRKDASTGANYTIAHPTAERIVEEGTARPQQGSLLGRPPAATVHRHHCGDISTSPGIDELADRLAGLADPAGFVHGTLMPRDDPAAKHRPVSSKSSDAYRADRQGARRTADGTS